MLLIWVGGGAANDAWSFREREWEAGLSCHFFLVPRIILFCLWSLHITRNMLLW